MMGEDEARLKCAEGHPRDSQPLDFEEQSSKTDSQAAKKELAGVEFNSVGSPGWPDPLAPEAFHGLAGDIVRTIEPHSEADPVALLVQLLVAFGNVIGPNAFWMHEATRHVQNLFAVLVGASSRARKGTSWNHIKALFLAVDGCWRAHAGGLSSGEGLIYAVRDGDGEKDAGEADKRLVVVEEEFCAALKVMERQGNTLSPVLRQAWDGLTLRPLTKNARIQATGAHISIIGHITKDELTRYLSATEMGNGFGNRFLWLCCRRSKLLPKGSVIPTEQVKEFINRLRPIVEWASRCRELSRDQEAAELWEKTYAQLSSPTVAGLAGAMTARAEAQTMRIAALYALLDQSELIDSAHLKAALAVWRYTWQSVRYIFGDSLGDPIADALLEALRDRPEGFTRTEIRDLFGRNQNARSITLALGSLQELGLACVTKEETKGRPVERCSLVRPRRH
jgi:hypothetical protein